MAKVFLSFYNGVPKYRDLSGASPYYEGFIKGLVDAGNDVMVFQSNAFFITKKRKDELDDVLRGDLDRFNPDVIIAFNNYGPRFSRLVDCPIIVYGVDSPRDYYDTSEIVNNPCRYRHVVVTDNERKILRKEFGISDDLIATASFFTEIQAANKEKTVPISFIGSRFAGASFHWNEFRSRNADYKASQMYQRLLDTLRKDPYADIGFLNEQYGELGLGAADYASIMRGLGAEKRIQILSCVADLGLELFGTEDWFKYGGESADLYCSYNPRRLYSLKQNQDLYNSSKICLNINHVYAVEGFAWRVCDIMASSGCLVSEWTPCLSRYFPEVAIPTFRNKFEAHEQCKRVLDDDKFRQDIVALSNQIINDRFRFKHILPAIEEIAGLPLHSTDKGSVSFLESGSSSLLANPRTKSQLICDLAKLLLSQIFGVKSAFKPNKRVRRIFDYYNLDDGESFRNVRGQLWSRGA